MSFSEKLASLFLAATLGTAGVPALAGGKPRAVAAAAKAPAVSCTSLADLAEAIAFSEPLRVKACFDQGADTRDDDILSTPALRGDMEIVQIVLEKGNPSAAALVKALATACLRGHEGIAGMLLDKKYNIDLNKTDARFLAYAARGGHVPVLRTLIAAGARDDDGFAVASAIDAGQEKTFDYLIGDGGISPNAGNGMVLSMAMKGGGAYFVKALLDKGADAFNFPVVGEALEEIRRGHAEGGPYSAPVYGEIISLVEEAMKKAAEKKVEPPAVTAVTSGPVISGPAP